MPHELSEMQKQMVGSWDERLYDDEAMSMSELRDCWRCSWTEVRKRIDEKIKSGEWEIVWRKIPGHGDFRVYRIKR